MLEPDRDQLEIFVNALFRHVGQGGYVSLRSFLPDSKVLKPIRAVVMNDNGSLIELIDVAQDQARRAATNQIPAVFCPPIAVFNSREGWQAREKTCTKASPSPSNATSAPTRRAGRWRNCSGRRLSSSVAAARGCRTKARRINFISIGG